jgi:hypothetical protein
LLRGQEDFFFGTFAPFFRASDKPIAIACFGFVTFLPLRPLFNLPRFISRISVSTCLPAEGLYFRVDFFALFFAGDFEPPFDVFAAFFGDISYPPGAFVMNDIT